MAIDLELDDCDNVHLRKSSRTPSTLSTERETISDTLKRINAVLRLENKPDHTIDEISEAINRLSRVLDESDRSIPDNERATEMRRVARALELENPNNVTAEEIVEHLGSLFAVFG